MAYTVLARRYRSTTFDEVIGQNHVAQTLKRAITSGRIAHAYLFCGTRGTGKTSMARILAKALNCLAFDKPTPTPCGKCSSCVGIARGEDMDYVEIDAASNTQVDKTREAIIDNVAYRPALCRFKIFLIDEVHMLSKGSFNALLKTLEEPPEHVKFILATTEAEKIPATILSRCQRYDFRNISTREVAGHLSRIAGDEGIKADDDALMMVARAGGGSMRDSLSLLDRLFSVGETDLTVAAIENLLGLPRGEQIAALVDAIGNAEPGKALAKTDEILAAGMSPDSLISGLVDHLHNLLLLNVCGDKTDLVEAPGIKPEILHAQAKKIEPALLTQDIAVLEELRRQLRSGNGGRALMDATIVRLALAEQFRSISDLLNGSSGGAVTDEKKKLTDSHVGSEKLEIGSTQTALPSAPVADLTRAINQLRTPPVPVPAVPATSLANSLAYSNAHAPNVATSSASAGAASTATGRAADSPTAAAISQVSSPAPLPAVASTPAVPVEDEDDDLPRPGKVWDSSGPSLSELLKQQKAKDSAAEPQPSPEPANVEFVDESKLPQIWQDALEGFKRSLPLVHGVLASGRLGSIVDGQVTVHLPAEQQFLSKSLDKEGRREKVAAVLSQAFGQPLGLRIVLEQHTQGTNIAPVAEVPRIAKPRLEDVAAQMATEPERPLVPAVAQTSNAIRLTDELKSELMQDDLIRAVVDGLKGQIVKVANE